MKALKGEGKYLPGPGGTTTCVVTDRWGNMVAATPSANRGGGGKTYSVCKKTGVSHGNRLRSFNTTIDHPNRIKPGKRPRITLTPTLVLKDGEPVIAISVAGGDVQDQVTLSCLLNNIEFGMLPAQAVTALRFNTSHHEGSFDTNPNRKEALGTLAGLNVYENLDGKVTAELKNRGHNVTTTPDFIGFPVMIYKDPKTKVIYAAGDPRTNRHAGALE